MQRRRMWVVGFVAVAVAMVAALGIFLFWPEPQERIAASTTGVSNDSLVERGEYLARAADCFACHTVSGGRPFAGGLPFKLPFGTIYSTNITPDGETGIGSWTDAEFARALHRGVGKHGEMLYPAFPYASYARMGTEDALAIKAYLFSLSPVHAPARENTLGFPYNQRYLMRFWRALFVPSQPFTPDPKQSPEWNRGAYLADALGHCGECHTPRNFLYGLNDSRKFAGETAQGWRAYNITSDRESGIGAWSNDELVQFLTKGYAPGRGSASGNMAEAVEHSLRYLSRADAQALATYLKSVPAQRSDPPVNPEPQAVKASSQVLPAAFSDRSDLGRQLFESACASCHSWNGEGRQTAAASLLGSRSVNDPAGTNLVQVILRGSSLTTEEGKMFMPPFGRAYDNVEVAALANYVIGHFGGKEAHITPDVVAAARDAGQ